MNNAIAQDLLRFEKDLEAAAAGYPEAPDDLITYIRAEMYLKQLDGEPSKNE